MITREREIDNDVTGTDGDIEALVGVYAAKLWCTRDQARAEIVRELSVVGHGRRAARLAHTRHDR